MPDSPTFAKIAFNVLYANISLNGLASLTTLCLILSMRRAGRLKFNLYTKCVIQMTFLQLLYEIAAANYIADTLAVPFTKGAGLGHTSTSRVVITGLLLLGGVGSSVWSMMLLFGALFTVQYSRQPTHKEQVIACVVVNALLVGYTIQVMVATHAAWHAISYRLHSETFHYYNVIRLVLIVLSGICLLRLYQVMMQTSIKGERFRSPLFHLLKKIAPYVIILVAVRFGGSTYPWIYKEEIYKITANADGWQIFWMYVFILLLPLTGFGFLIAFIYVTAGAKRSLIQMLHLECIFTLPDAPASWAADNNIDLRLDGESTMRPTTVQEEHDRLITMDEHDLAAAVASHSDTRERESSSNARRMSEQEEGGGGSKGKPRNLNPNPGLYQI